MMLSGAKIRMTILMYPFTPFLFMAAKRQLYFHLPKQKHTLTLLLLGGKVLD